MNDNFKLDLIIVGTLYLITMLFTSLGFYYFKYDKANKNYYKAMEVAINLDNKNKIMIDYSNSLYIQIENLNNKIETMENENKLLKDLRRSR